MLEMHTMLTRAQNNEGWPGYRINSTLNEFRKSAHLKPNLVLINAGT
jgi:hypothetical protein